jgi:hypothetical protein
MPGARCTRSLACEIKKHTSIVTTVTPEITRHSPRNGFTAYFALSPVGQDGQDIELIWVRWQAKFRNFRKLVARPFRRLPLRLDRFLGNRLICLVGQFC